MQPTARFLFALVCIVSGLCTQAQTIFTYGSSAVSRQEFLTAFLKNNNEIKPSEKTFREYLELYIRFKLKVKAARDMQLDTLQSQKAEWRSFRNQVAANFLNDTASLQKLVKEAFTRSLKDIHLAHIIIPFDNPRSADTLKAWRQAMDAYHELEKGTDFGNVAALYSADSSAVVNKGDIGFITVFTLPYPLENLAYSTPAGKSSPPFHSEAGYHIFKNIGERPAIGKVRAAQILLSFPPGADDSTKSKIRKKADSLYNALQQGADFKDLARKFSDDNASYSNQGELPEFGTGEYQPEFENAVLALKPGGAVSKPFLTRLGYHIVKNIGITPVNTDSANEQSMAALRQQVQNDALRMEVSRKLLLATLGRVTGLKKATVNESQLFAYADSSLKRRKLPAFPGINGRTILLSFTNYKLQAADWINYLKNSSGTGQPSGKSYKALLQEYTDSMTLGYYRDHLETFNPEFAAQVKDFKEGNLLFEIMQRNIWDKAASDSVGLRSYYDAHRDKYWWQPGVEAILFTVADSAVAWEAWLKLSKEVQNRGAILASYEDRVQADSGRFEMTQLTAYQDQELTKGTLTKPRRIAGEDKGYSFLYIIKSYPEKAPRTFEDAKGYVLNDYQAFLEEKWIASLKKKYPIRVNEPVLQTLWK